jgi:hypothetical protein
MKHLIKTTALSAVLAATFSVMTLGAANAGSLENLERERAILIEAYLDGGLSADERSGKTAGIQRRLVDLERMAMRDDALTGKNTPDVRRAFSNYDLTFMVHASLENDTPVVEHWLSKLGLSTSTLMAARVGRP